MKTITFDENEWQLVPKKPSIEMVAALAFGGDVDMAIGHGAICEEAVRLYEAMLAVVAQPAAEGWIPVSERMPAIDMDAPEYARDVSVIAWSKWWSKPRQLRYRSNGHAKTKKGRAPRWEEMHGSLAYSEPTHWMPMPEIPTVKQEGESHAKG